MRSLCEIKRSQLRFTPEPLNVQKRLENTNDYGKDSMNN
jgi:hypothetical protein